MDQQSEIPSEVVLTTETLRGSLGRILAFLFFSGIGVGFAIIVLLVSPPLDFARLLCGVAIQLTFLSLALVVLLFRRGIWTIDSDGIRYQPCHGRGRYLAWAAVERMQWNRRFIILRGESARILLDMEQFPRGCRAPAMAAIEAHLSGDFDLKPVEQGGPFVWSRVAIVAAVSSALIVAIVAGMIAAFRVFPGADGAISRIFAVPMFAMLVGPVIFGVFLARAQDNAVREKHPEWPWRVRRSKLKSSAPIDREFEIV